MNNKKHYQSSIKCRKITGLLGIAAAASHLASCHAGGETSNAIQKPNIVFILTDDQRWDAMSCLGHPIMKTPNLDMLRNRGALFRNAFVTTSLCAPSRASFLTGTYAHTHKVVGNWGCEFDHNRTPSFPKVLQQSGYNTAFIGKWHMRKNADPRPGFDYWLSFKGQGVYMDPELNENGRKFKAKGYTTDLLTDYAVNFIKKERNKPFCLYLSHKAVHSPFDAGPKYRNSYPDANLIEPPNAKDTFTGKPEWLRGGKAYPSDSKREVPESINPKPWNPKHKRWLNYMRTINAVDDGVGRIMQVLKDEGMLENTVIVFAGDNGYFHGEHGRGDKRLIYEESIRIPLLMSYPRLIRPGSTIDQIVLNIDIAPTILAVAGVLAPTKMQGHSLLPLFAGKSAGWRKSFLYEYWMDLTDQVPHMLGVRTQDWKLVIYPDIDDIDEMYDLKNDPYEMKNLAQNPEYTEKHKALSRELDRLLKETGYDRNSVPDNPYMSKSHRRRSEKP